MTAEDGGAQEAPPHAERIIGILTANISLAVAALFYMGWSYSQASLGYFQLNPMDLQFGFTDYMLRSSASLFSSFLVALGALWLLVLALPRLRLHELLPESLRRAIPAAVSGRWSALAAAFAGTLIRRRLGLLLLLAAGFLLVLAEQDVYRATYLILALTGVGVLLISTPDHPRGGLPAYALALVIASACGLWAASLYASAKGTETASRFARNLPSQTSAVVYSDKPLALSGPGVTVEKLPKGYRYGYRYLGLKLLMARSGTYYLLPVGWRHGVNATHVIKESDDLRVELVPGGG